MSQSVNANKSDTQRRQHSPASVEYQATLLYLSFAGAKVRRNFNIPKENIKKIQYILIFRNIYQKCSIFPVRYQIRTYTAHIAQNYAKCAIPIYLYI